MPCNGCYRYFHRFTVFEWTGENDSNTLRVNAFFVDKLNLKKCPFSNISGYAWRSPKVCKHIPVLKQDVCVRHAQSWGYACTRYSAPLYIQRTQSPQAPSPPKKKVKEKKERKRTFLQKADSHQLSAIANSCSILCFFEGSDGRDPAVN